MQNGLETFAVSARRCRRLLVFCAPNRLSSLLDPESLDSDTGAVLPVTEMGIERDGFRGNSLVVNASMGSEETGWAGIYLTEVR